MATFSESNSDRPRNSSSGSARRPGSSRGRRPDEEDDLADAEEVFEIGDDVEIGTKKKSSKRKGKVQLSTGKRVLMLAAGGVAFIVSFVAMFMLMGYLRRPNRMPLAQPQMTQVTPVVPQFVDPSMPRSEAASIPPSSSNPPPSEFGKSPDLEIPESSPPAPSTIPGGTSEVQSAPATSPSPSTPATASPTTTDRGTSSTSNSNPADAGLMAQPKIKALMDKPTPGAVITAETPLKPGMVLINERSGNRWRPVTVLDVLPNGDVKIHFINWANSWDTVVKRSTLRLPPDESINDMNK